MIKWAFIVTLVCLCVFIVFFSAKADWRQPEWAPTPLPLQEGAVYQSGSPLSQPGLMGLLGGILGLEGYEGGGYEVWDGPSDPRCMNCVIINGQEVATFSLQEARDILATQPLPENAPHGFTEQRQDGKPGIVSSTPDCKSQGKRLHQLFTPDGPSVRISYICAP